MKKNVTIIAGVIIVLILCIYFFSSGVSEAKQYRNESSVQHDKS